MTYRVGVDIGGTFTDFCAFDNETNSVLTLKVLSEPLNPGAEVMRGIKELESRYGVKPQEITYFTHGTTVGVNTLIQRKGIKLALFVTENFEDVLEVARLKMPDPYNLLSTPPKPLIPRERVVSVSERTQEIGLRKAVGARSGDVLLQFLVEALVVSSLGGLLGSGLGVGAVMAVAAFTPLPASIGAVSVLGTVLLSGSIGLFFGVVPARRAAQLDPIVALRRL